MLTLSNLAKALNSVKQKKFKNQVLGPFKYFYYCKNPLWGLGFALVFILFIQIWDLSYLDIWTAVAVQCFAIGLIKTYQD